MATADLTESLELIQVDASYNERHLMTQVPGARFKDGRWVAPRTWATCVMLRGLFGSKLTVGSALGAWAWHERQKRLDPATALRDVLSLTSVTDLPPETVSDLEWMLKELHAIEEGATLKLYDYQVVDVAFLVVNRRALLANEPGLGKTGVVIRAMQLLHRMGQTPFPALITCPNSLKRTVWAKELERWAPELTVSVIDGGAAARRQAIEIGANVSVINWESLRLHSRLAKYGQTELTEGEEKPKELNALRPHTVVFDEAHRGKEPHAKQTRAAWALAETAKYRVAMTGTPVANTLADLWPLLHLVEPTWFPAKTRFMNRYAVQTPNFYGGNTVLGIRPDTRDELFSVVNPLMRRVPKTAALPQLPPKLPIQYRETPMGAKQAKAYRQMEDHMIAMLESGELLAAPNPLSQLTRLQQFAAASAELVDDQVHLTNPSSKVDDLVDLLEEMGEAPLVVAAVSRQLIELAAERLAKDGISFGLVTGAQSTHERQVAVDRFQGGQARVILLTLGAGAEGLTLTRADTMLFMQQSYSVIQNKQAEDRIHRIGSEVHQSVRIIVQVTPGTVEERRLEVLAGKEERIQEVVRDAEVLAKLLGVKSKTRKEARTAA
jgi:SNF2 family DNA or RNA helicase